MKMFLPKTILPAVIVCMLSIQTVLAADYSLSEPKDSGQNGISYMVMDDDTHVGSIINLHGIIRAYLIGQGQVGDTFESIETALAALNSEN